MHKGNPDGICMKRSRRWWKLNIKLLPSVKREREREREKKERKRGGREKEEEEVVQKERKNDDILSNSIGPANEIALIVLIAYANRRPLICRKTSESLDVGSPCSQESSQERWLFVTWLLFSWTKPHVRNQDEPGVQTLHVLRSGILKRTRLVCSRAATVETWDNRIVSAVASIRLVPLSRKEEDAWKAVWESREFLSRSRSAIEHDLENGEKNIIESLVFFLFWID